MTTKQIIQEQMKSFDYEFVITSQWQQKEWRSKYSTDFVKAFIHSYTRKLIESLAEEICPEWIDNPYGEVSSYTVGRRDERKEQRLKVKEIINQISK